MALRPSPQASFAQSAPDTRQSGGEGVVREMARFRYALRKFLRFSEEAARRCGVTPQQHQLMLGIAGYTGRGSATVSELAEFMQERPHSVVGLIERAVQHGLVRRTQDETDRRVVNVSLTPSGREILSDLTRLHQEETRAFKGFLGLAWPQLRHGPEPVPSDRARRTHLDLTTEPEELREKKGNVRTK